MHTGTGAGVEFVAGRDILMAVVSVVLVLLFLYT